jgi:hypothetical protein
LGSERREGEKDALPKENADRLEAAKKDLSDRILKGDHDQADALQKGIRALFAFRERIESNSTVPWKRNMNGLSGAIRDINEMQRPRGAEPQPA